MVSFCEYNHKKYLPFCGTVGWDIFIDREVPSRAIEINIKTLGVRIEQVVSGTFYETFRDEIFHIFKNNTIRWR